MATKPAYITNVYGLSDEEILATCPSIGALSPMEGVSDLYAYIPTIQILAGMRKEGFVPTMAAQSGSRKVDMENKTMHQIRFRRQDQLGVSKLNVFELLLTNSHNRSSAYVLEAGAYRLVCSNGLVRWSADDMIRVRHYGNIVDNVIEGSYRILDEGDETLDEIAQMQSIQLTRPERLLLAQNIMRERFHVNEEEEGKESAHPAKEEKEIPYHPAAFLRAQRQEDTARDLYTTFNVAEEWAKRGGVQGYDARGNRHTSRPVGNISDSTRLDRAAWRFAQVLMKFRQGGETIPDGTPVL